MDKLIRIARLDREKTERDTLAIAATQSTESRGRDIEEPPDPLRTAFERDRDRIVHCNAIRRLAHKTQVFMNPDDDHFVTRLTHTLQVSQVGRSMAVALGLNEALTEAICLGHDIGHSPFGHTGEDALSAFVEGEWLHSAQSVRILTILEPLNLTWETLDGIRAHSWKINPGPPPPRACCADSLTGSPIWPMTSPTPFAARSSPTPTCPFVPRPCSATTTANGSRR